MRKIPSLYQRDRSDPKKQTLVRDEVTPGCEWVLEGEGRATRKWDGTAVLVKDGQLYARYDAKGGKPAPAGGIPCQDAPDPETGHWPHWVKADRKVDEWIREAASYSANPYGLDDGTYEACGPKIQGNPEGLDHHMLFGHGKATVSVGHRAKEGEILSGAFLSYFECIKSFLSVCEIEGIVWHHPDGRMCKIKAKDFGIAWPRKKIESAAE